MMNLDDRPPEELICLPGAQDEPWNKALGCGQVGERVNSDMKQPTAMGRKLVELCKDTGVLILNGRLPGDEQGKNTYLSLGKQGTSLIDYFIASRDLIFDTQGAPREGVNMCVLSHRECPQKRDGTRFDHAPIYLTVPPRTGEHQVDQGKRVQRDILMPLSNQPRYIWSTKFQNHYIDIIKGDQGVTEGLKAVQEIEDEKLKTFNETLAYAMAQLNERVGGAALKRPARTKGLGHRPMNSWYGEDCKQARENYINLVKTKGEKGAGLALNEYKRITRAAKRVWEARRDEQRRRMLCKDPKAFWAKYREASRKEQIFGLTEWTEYFAKLFQGGGLVGMVDEDMFPPPAEDQIKRAECLNKSIEIAEVFKSIKTDKKWKGIWG
jgi:hypothetical protein